MTSASRPSFASGTVAGLPRVAIEYPGQLADALQSINRDPSAACVKVLEGEPARGFHSWINAFPESMLLVEYSSKPDGPHSFGVATHRVSPAMLEKDFKAMAALHSKAPRVTVEPYALVTMQGTPVAIAMQAVQGERLNEAFNRPGVEKADMKALIRAAYSGLEYMERHGAFHLDVHPLNIFYKVEQVPEGETVSITFIDPQPKSRRYITLDRTAHDLDRSDFWSMHRASPATNKLLMECLSEVHRELKGVSQYRLFEISQQG